MRYPLKNWKKIKRGYKFGEKTFYSDFHLGTDYIVPEGTPVFAPAVCEIVKSGNFPEGGNTIQVKITSRKYGRLVMRFMHLSKMSPLGKYKAGEILGRTGNTGKLTRGPHLHIDLSRGKVDVKNRKNFINPEKFFSLNSSISNRTPKINKAWHLKNKMPKNATIEQKIKWHEGHAKNCSCRDSASHLKKLKAKTKKHQTTK